MHERRAEVAPERRFEKERKLYPERPIETEPHDRLLAFDLVGLRADQNIDRIAERVYADKHQGRHCRDDE